MTTDDDNRAKIAFLAGMGHEFRSPLNAVIGFAEVILQELEGPLGNPIYREYAAYVVGGGHQLLALIDDLFDLLKAEADGLDLWEDSVNVQDIVLTCVRLSADAANRAGVRIVNEASPAVPPLWADGRGVRQMVLNLLAKTMASAQPGATITVATGQDASGDLRIAVQGVGTDATADELVWAMAPWEHATGVSHRQPVGTDLRLPRAKLLIERHGGRLDIAEAPGHGTRMTLVFPAWRVGANGPQAPTRDG